MRMTLDGKGLLQSTHFFARGEQAIYGAERIVGPGVQEESRGTGCVEDTGRWRQDRSLDWLEGAFEAVENAIKLHRHLIGERPAGDVVWRRRRCTGIGEVAGMILRLKQVEHVSPER